MRYEPTAGDPLGISIVFPNLPPAPIATAATESGRELLLAALAHGPDSPQARQVVTGHWDRAWKMPSRGFPIALGRCGTCSNRTGVRCDLCGNGLSSVLR